MLRGCSANTTDEEVRRRAIAASFAMTELGGGLREASPQRPGQDVLERQAGERLQAADETADFICVEIDQRSGASCRFLPLAIMTAAAALSLTRITAGETNTSMARVRGRHPPYRERISSPAKPISCLATSKHSSMARRRLAMRAGAAKLMSAGPKQRNRPADQACSGGAGRAASDPRAAVAGASGAPAPSQNRSPLAPAPTERGCHAASDMAAASAAAACWPLPSSSVDHSFLLPRMANTKGQIRAPDRTAFVRSASR